MALAKNVRAYIATSRATSAKRHTQTIKGNWAASMSYLRAVDVKSADEPSAASARAIDKVLMLPGSPSAPST